MATHPALSRLRGGASDNTATAGPTGTNRGSGSGRGGGRGRPARCETQFELFIVPKAHQTATATTATVELSVAAILDLWRMIRIFTADFFIAILAVQSEVGGAVFLLYHSISHSHFCYISHITFVLYLTSIYPHLPP